jgi:hypothetical protein
VSILNAIADHLTAHLAQHVTFLVDLPGHPHHYSNFPARIHPTAQRPDIVLHTDKEVWLIELTVPAEQNAAAADVCKTSRYTQLLLDIQAGGHYTAHLYTVQVCSRGLHDGSLTKALRALAKGNASHCSTPAAKRLAMRCSTIALNCSYFVWLTRSNPAMPAHFPLL